MRYEVYTLVGSTWRSRGEVNAASAEEAARIYSIRSGHRLVRVKPEGRLGEYKVFDFTRKKNPMARKRRKIKRNPRRTRRVKTWVKRVKRHRRKHNTVGRGFYTPAGRAVYGYLKEKKNPSVIHVRTGNGSWSDYSNAFTDSTSVISRSERLHKGWQSVKYKGKRYRLGGGIRTPFYINLSLPVKGRN